MENLRKRCNVKIVGSEEKYLKHVARPTFKDGSKINDHLYIIKRIKEELVLNRPCYVGMSILDLSKSLMFDFHYNYIRKKYGERSKFVFHGHG